MVVGDVGVHGLAAADADRQPTLASPSTVSRTSATISSASATSSSMRTSTMAASPSELRNGGGAAEAPVRRHLRDAVDGADPLGQLGAGGLGGGRVDVATGGRGDEHEVGLARVEVAAEDLAGPLALRRRVLEPAALEHAEGPGAEHDGDDHEQHGERQHQPSPADREPPQSGEHARTSLIGPSRSAGRPFIVRPRRGGDIGRRSVPRPDHGTADDRTTGPVTAGTPAAYRDGVADRGIEPRHRAVDDARAVLGRRRRARWWPSSASHGALHRPDRRRRTGSVSCRGRWSPAGVRVPPAVFAAVIARLRRVSSSPSTVNPGGMFPVMLMVVWVARSSGNWWLNAADARRRRPG